MDDIFEKIKSSANVLKKNAEKVTKQVVRKTNDAVSQTKLSFAISETENKISEIYADMGESLYSEYLKDGDVPESMIESCEQISKLFEEVDALKEQIAELKQSVKCPGCGDYNKNDAAYCSKCGKDLRADEVAGEQDDTDEVEDDTNDKKVVTIRARKPVNQED